MKNVLGWVKSNVWIVVLGVIILVAPPVAFVFSGGWNTSIQEERQREVSKEYTTLTGLKVNHVLPGETADAESVSLSSPPNEKTTAFFAEKRAAYTSATTRAVEAALRFNHKDRGVLMPELLPEPPSDREQLLVTRMADMIVPSRDPDSPTAFQQLFQRVNAVRPVHPPSQAERLKRERDRQFGQLGFENENSAPDDVVEQITAQLAERRLGEILGRARAGLVYADEDSLPETIPFRAPAQENVNLVQCFLWQFDYWVVEDLLSAITEANSARTTPDAGITGALIKRVVRIEPDEFVVNVPSENDGRRGSRGGRGGRGRGGAQSGLLKAPKSITEYRQGNSQLWDLRRVYTTLIVDADRVPEVIEVLSSSNFTFVVGVEMDTVDVNEHLKQGFYYGSEPVVEVTFELEMLWLREWTKQYMPNPVKAALGIPVEGGEG